MILSESFTVEKVYILPRTDYFPIEMAERYTFWNMLFLFLNKETNKR